MKIWRFQHYGDIENLKLVEAAKPEPAAGEALLRMNYAALNPADAFVVRGLYPRSGPPPMAVGRDGSGTIETTVPGDRFNIGDRAVVLRSEIGVTRDGTLAQYCAVPEASLAPLPEGWTMQEGAAGPLVFLTAWQALVSTGKIRAGDTIFVNGASGGVGSATVMLAHALGAHVVAASRSAEKRAKLKELGADMVVDSTNPDHMEDEVKTALGGGRVDIVVENLGGAFLQAGINVLAEGGRIAVVGLLAGFISEFSLGNLIHKRVRMEGVSVGALTPPQAQNHWAKIVGYLKKTGAKPIVDAEFDFSEVHAAFERLAQGPMGKVCVRIQ